MRKIGLITLMMMMLSVAAFAQPGPENNSKREVRKQKVQAAKIAFITQQLTLTPQEAEKFWPVYNQWEADKKMLRSKNKVDKKKMGTLSDKEAETLILNRLATEEDLAKLNKDYYFKLKQVIAPTRILQLQRAERQFKKQLLKRINENKKGKGNYNRPRGDRRQAPAPPPPGGNN